MFVVRNENGTMIVKGKDRKLVEEERRFYESETGRRTSLSVEKEPIEDNVGCDLLGKLLKK